MMPYSSDVPDPVPPDERSTWFARRSSWVLIAALVLAMGAIALTLHQGNMQRAFAEPTASAMGTVRSSGSLFGKRSSGAQSICWVSYEFTPAAGMAQQNWRFWEPGCGITQGRPIHIQYVVAHPEVNRPAGETWSLSPLFIWFAAGVLLVVGFLLRSSDHSG